jgi:hypothetical protein
MQECLKLSGGHSEKQKKAIIRGTDPFPFSHNPSEKIKGTASAVPFSLPASDHATDLFQDHDADLYENASQDGVHLNHLLSK